MYTTLVMATSVRKLLDQVSDPSTKAAYSELCFKHARDAATKASAIAPFAVSDSEALGLERMGITTSPFATTSHTHAADKIIENDCLSIIGHYLPKNPVTLIQLKRSKLHLLGRGANSDHFANYSYEPKDVLRYGTANPHYCPKVTTEYAVLADTLHFMSPHQLVTLFLKNSKLQMLFATLVLPIEALHKLPSLFPEIYRLEYLKDHFVYMPGGHGGAAYVHSYHTLQWLSTAQIGTHTNNILSIGSTDFITLEKIETKAAHHIMVVQRRRSAIPWPVPPIWVFHASDMVKLPHIFYPAEANVQNAYPNTLIKRMQAYCFSVKAVSLRDIFAKLRQVLETSDLQKYSMPDLVRLANYLLFTTGMQQVSDYDSFLTKGWLARLSSRIQMRIRQMLQNVVGQSSYAALLSVLDTIPMPFITKPRAVPAVGPEWFHEEYTEGKPEHDGPENCSLEDIEMLAELDQTLTPHTQTETKEPQSPNGQITNQNTNSAATSSKRTNSENSSESQRRELFDEEQLIAEMWAEIETVPDLGSSSKIESSIIKTPTENGGEQMPTSDFDSRTTEILRIHGFTALKQQSDGISPIMPVYFNDKTDQLCKSKIQTGCPFMSMATDIKRHFYDYTIDNRRGQAYMSDVKNNLTGLVLPKLSRETLQAWVSLAENSKRTIPLLVIHGAGGAGKSQKLQETLRAIGAATEDVNIILPTVNLLKDWKDKMNQMDTRRFMTFEKAFEREGNRIVIFDDYGKLPAGLIDAYLSIKPTVSMVILTGDQRQSTYHSANKESQSAQLPTNIAHFRKYCDYYINATHRQPKRLANPIRVHAQRLHGGSVKKENLIKNGQTVLVPAHRTQISLTDLGRPSLTYSGCQGLTLPHITIALDSDTPLCSDEVLYTAFSRASESITFVNTYSENPDFLAKLDATPYLKTLLSGVREDEEAGSDLKPAEPEVREPQIKTHLPVTNTDTFLESKVEKTEDKDTRELWDGSEKTNLAQTQDPVIQMFPHQQAKDEALFKLTIQQRIKTASPEENRKELSQTINVGNLLFEAYADFMKVPKEPQPFDKALWINCLQTAQRTYLSKPTANLQQGANRQDPDFPDNAIALFNKSQWVKKMEKVGFKFKAGQTISAFKQQTVLITTTMALYLRRQRERHQPGNIFIMCEKTPDQFNDFVMNNWNFDRPSYTSDYSQYDQSQNGPFLNFELRKARHFGVPDEVLEFYQHVKCYAQTFVGNLAIMRLSGEGPTFDANTECNIAYDALRFQLNDQVNACYAGDDLVRDQVCPERSCWKYCHEKFNLVAKPLATNKPDFCGYRLTKYGIVKSPIQLYQSLELAIRLGKTEEVKRSYAIDYLQAYRLGDKLFEIFDEKEMEAHQLTTRVLTKKGMKAPSEGDHMPSFHITSDRLIRNPHYAEMQDTQSHRIYTEKPNFVENHFT
ncbi:RNA-dependent RNA polymerase [Vanilla latent virus]|uniref:RNA-dependent RNA polymerase n=1 Tax=Vanilla latent virus TaxID=2016426 RepID=A0A220NQ47_9VIRU|nr:RNA-dependent RNA polymerase [Vanilla latent virus]ASJ78783.1 RNA-dependent RNA polymerase [Vanilla latent virus]